MKILRVLLLAAAAVVLGWLTGHWMHRSDEAAPEPVTAFSLLDMNGQQHAIADYHGQLVLVNFWATWCAPCRKEIPLLNATYQQHRNEGLVILGPAIDDSAQIARFAAELDIQYPVIAGGSELFALMDQLGDTLGALPFSVLIDRQGLIVARHWGELHAEQLRDWLDLHL